VELLRLVEARRPVVPAAVSRQLRVAARRERLPPPAWLARQRRLAAAQARAAARPEAQLPDASLSAVLPAAASWLRVSQQRQAERAAQPDAGGW